MVIILMETYSSGLREWFRKPLGGSNFVREFESLCLLSAELAQMVEHRKQLSSDVALKQILRHWFESSIQHYSLSYKQNKIQTTNYNSTSAK